MSFNFMAAVTVCSDFGAQEIKSVTVSNFCLTMLWRSFFFFKIIFIISFLQEVFDFQLSSRQYLDGEDTEVDKAKALISGDVPSALGSQMRNKG